MIRLAYQTVLGFDLTRAQMPQIEGGMTLSELQDSTDNEHQQKAEAIAATGGSSCPNKTVMEQLLDQIRSMGHTVSHGLHLPVGSLRPTQNEIDSDKVLSMAGAYHAGDQKLGNLTDNPIVVSNDNYILDGHHRWGALYILDTNLTMPVVRVSMPMSELLYTAHAMPGVYKVDVEGKPVSKKAQVVYKVASRSLVCTHTRQARTTELGPTTIATLLDYIQALNKVTPDPEDPEVLRATYRDRLMSGETFNSMRWPLFLRVGQEVADWILETREIPQGLAKDTELACRLFKSTVRAPKDIYGWWVKNKKRVLLLISAQKWPPRSSEQAVFQHGPFTIHNTLQWPTDKLQATLDAVDHAVRLLHQASPKLAGVAYGDVFLAGQVLKSGTLAWYQIDRDILFLRPQLKIAKSDEHSILHELGHRFYFTKIAKPNQYLWNNYHLKQSWHSPAEPVKLPEVGDVFPIQLSGKKNQTGQVLVTAVERDTRSGQKVIRLSTGGYVLAEAVYKILRQQQVVKEAFPSTYASTSPEENYAETFAYFVMEPGRLTEQQIETFKQVSGL